MIPSIQWLPVIINCSLALGIFRILVIQKPVLNNYWELVTRSSLFIYLIGVIYLTFCPITSWHTSALLLHRVTINLIPFNALTSDFFLNILMTVPLGCYLYLIKRPSLATILVIGLATGISIESGQFIYDLLFNIGRSIDINDIITNTLGVLGGYLIIMGLNKTFIKNMVNRFSLIDYDNHRLSYKY